MIIMGYDFIGKSEFAASTYKRIDLDLHFFHSNIDKWWVHRYMWAMQEYHKQGYTVLLGYDKEALQELQRCTGRLVDSKDVFVVFPAIWLKDVWVDKSKEAYDQWGTPWYENKWCNIKHNFEKEISDMELSTLNKVVIPNASGNLESVYPMIANHKENIDD